MVQEKVSQSVNHFHNLIRYLFMSDFLHTILSFPPISSLLYFQKRFSVAQPHNFYISFTIIIIILYDFHSFLCLSIPFFRDQDDHHLKERRISKKKPSGPTFPSLLGCKAIVLFSLLPFHFPYSHFLTTRLAISRLQH